jgi:hypothetical protein
METNRPITHNPETGGDTEKPIVYKGHLLKDL